MNIENQRRNFMNSCINSIEQLPLIMTVKDVVNFLGISSTNAYAIFNRSDFPAIRINRRKLVSRDKFFQWLDMQTQSLNKEA
jgi:hypothetical protein